MRGFVFTAYGRRRYLPGNAARKAFNSIAQGTSADIIKERMVALAPRYNLDTRRMGIKPRANVHDELLSGVPLDSLRDPKVQDYMCGMLEDTSTKFRVPIRVGLGISAKNWSEAAGDETTLADGRTIDHADLTDSDTPVSGRFK